MSSDGGNDALNPENTAVVNNEMNMITSLTEGIVLLATEMDKATDLKIKAMYQSLLNTSVDEYESFMAAQRAMDFLTKQRAELIAQIEGTQIPNSFQVGAEKEKSWHSEDNIINNIFGKIEDTPDDDDTTH